MERILTVWHGMAQWCVSITPNAVQAPQEVQLFGPAIIYKAVRLFAMQCNYLQWNAICNAVQLFGPALPCGELRPDLAVHMNVQCILNQDDGGASIFSMKTKYFQSMDPNWIEMETNANRRQEEGLLEGRDHPLWTSKAPFESTLRSPGTFLQLKTKKSGLKNRFWRFMSQRGPAQCACWCRG